jgi:hypothetical protein
MKNLERIRQELTPARRPKIQRRAAQLSCEEMSALWTGSRIPMVDSTLNRIRAVFSLHSWLLCPY